MVTIEKSMSNWHVTLPFPDVKGTGQDEWLFHMCYARLACQDVTKSKPHRTMRLINEKAQEDVMITIGPAIKQTTGAGKGGQKMGINPPPLSPSPPLRHFSSRPGSQVSRRPSRSQQTASILSCKCRRLLLFSHRRWSLAHSLFRF